MIKFWSNLRGASLRERSDSTAPKRTATAVHACCDDEELAAFLDGRLRGRQRSKLVGHLAEVDNAYEVYACAAVMLSEYGDALLTGMQTAENRAASRRAFDASPDALRKAAIEAARSSEG